MVSIIIPVYGQLHLLMGCLASISRTATEKAELILVDDATPEFNLMDVPLPVTGKVVRMEQNGGFAQACNAGARTATGDVLFFLNSDTIAHESWQAALLAPFAEDKVAIVGPRLVFPVVWWCKVCRVYGPIVCPQHGEAECQQVEQIQSAGGLFDGNKGPFHRFFQWRSDAPEVNRQEDVPWVTGAALAVRKDVFEAIGGFDSLYVKGYFEDVNLCCAVRKRGGRVVYAPKSIFTHLVAQSTNTDGRTDAQRAWQFRQNSRRFHIAWDAEIAPNVGSIFVNY